MADKIINDRKVIKMEIKKIPKWEEKSIVEKQLAVLGLILSIAVIILAALSLTDGWQGTINVVELLLGLLMLVQTLQFWKYNKAIAIITLIAAILCFGAAIVSFF
ncbi:hypothetical protein [Clostridium aminobutyricum]|uniref:Uncharacterized protein n=1 Tax=Clostridium aminobutyricum TaxID=33953 RepID=A0A939D733_CLOAM|nr:hypothetical protein [Clostridium aminobutyricum]MBN7772320.1 hypothetical protein [Clostridium aminobutyricum]